MAVYKLDVIQGGKSESDAPLKPSEVVGSKPWADKLRKRAKDIVHTIDFGYTELAKILFELGYVSVDAEEQNSKFWAVWGYDSFVDWAEKDLLMHRRKAQHLARVYYTLEVKNQMKPEFKVRLVKLPFSKLRWMPRLVALGLDDEMMERWVVYAETTSHASLEKGIAVFVKDWLLHQSQSVLAKKILAGATIAELLAVAKGLEPKNDAGVANVESSEEDDDDADIASSMSMHDDDEDPAVLAGNAPPKVDPTFPMTFAPFADQHQLIEAALTHASSVSGSDKRAHNLALICMDYLNGIAPVQDAKAKLTYVARMEKLLGMRLVAVHATSGELLYGQEALELLANSLAEAEGQRDAG